jgi:hypothetical protein
MSSSAQPLASSYRDPSGFVFTKDTILYRQVNIGFKDHFDHFITTGCYDHFVNAGWLVKHAEVNKNLTGDSRWYKTLAPEIIPFISYSAEWSFDMLKDAALLTLQLAKESIRFGCVLKDATPFNIQWKGHKPVFIDTLSFEKYNPAEPWIAYRQFCECFLSPLLLMHYTKQPLLGLQTAYPEGIPLAVTKSLLPWRSRFSFYTYLHIHLHAKISGKQPATGKQQKIIFSEKKMLQLISSLESLVSSLQWKGGKTTWGDYYTEAAQREDYLQQKKGLITSWVNELPVLASCLDIGGNEGEFSKILAAKQTLTITADFDHSAINNLYNNLKGKQAGNIHPLLLDISNPTPATGFNNAERDSFIDRTRVDLVLALALIHHLCIGKNISFEMVASFFSKLTDYLLIEFVPKTDEKVQYMLSQKKDIYDNYTEADFTSGFKKYFSILKKEKAGNSGRTLFLMKKNA